MRKTLLLIPLTILLLVSSAHAAAISPLTLSTQTPFQGDALIVNLARSAQSVRTAFFDGKPISFFDYQKNARAVLPIAIGKKPGKYILTLSLQDGSRILRTITVRAKKFPGAAIAIPEKLNLTPLTLATTLTQKKSVLGALVKATSSKVFFDHAFQFPLLDPLRESSPFGELRNSGGTLVRHLGIDFAAPAGTPVYPINSGVVKEAYLDSLYGNSVIIDHGAGIFSLYLHLSGFNVRAGEHVTTHDIIGLVGDTGYATSPHLHLSVKILGESVSPAQFISRFK